MLVLSRKEKEDILFPGLGISVQILRVQGKSVRVGIAAPDDVRVLRRELYLDETDDASPAESDREARHALRNRMNSLQLALSLLQMQLDAQRFEEAETTLAGALKSLSELDQLAQRRQATTTSSLSKRRALVVEDNAQERELLAEYLRIHGYEVDVAENGRVALDYLGDRECPDVVLLDMNMPEMNGYRTAEAIRRDPRLKRAKLVIVSGNQPDEYLENENSPTPFDRWFSKPLSPRDFVEQLNEELSPFDGAA
jgi:carbon storage regulator CsrA